MRRQLHIMHLILHLCFEVGILDRYILLKNASYKTKHLQCLSLLHSFSCWRKILVVYISFVFQSILVAGWAYIRDGLFALSIMFYDFFFSSPTAKLAKRSIARSILSKDCPPGIHQPRYLISSL